MNECLDTAWAYDLILWSFVQDDDDVDDRCDHGVHLEMGGDMAPDKSQPCTRSLDMIDMDKQLANSIQESW